jgi:ABC-type transport system involved in multi-copper enzyme maturation permease subunit
MSTLTAAPPATTEQPTHARSGWTRLVRAELLKIWTTKSWWIFAICAFVATALALLVNLIQAHYELDQAQHPPDFGEGVPPPEQGGPSPEEIERQRAEFQAQFDLGRVLLRSAANIFTSGQYFGLLIVMLIGTLIVTNEFFHQTATATFLATPQRTRVILAKLAAAVGIATLFCLATTALDLAVGTIFFNSEHLSPSLDRWPVIRAMIFNLPAYAIWAVLGVGLGVLIRSQLGATLTGAGLYLIAGQVAQVVFFIFYQFVIKEAWVLQAMVILPSVASMVMISAERIQIGPANTVLPPWWVGTLVLIGYGVVAGVIGTLITRKRDIS